MMHRLFDPEGIRPEDYKGSYPELSKIAEFSRLNTRQILFVWWYSNPTSPLVLTVTDNRMRVEQALEKSGYNPGSARKGYLDLKFPENISFAIERMLKFDVPNRVKAYNMINKIFVQFESIVDNKDQFADEKQEVDEDGTVTITKEFDAKKYVDTAAKVAESLPKLINMIEEGFGIKETSKDDEEDSQEYSGYLGDYYNEKN